MKVEKFIEKRVALANATEDPPKVGLKRLIKMARRLAKPFRITDGDRFRLKDIDPGDTLHFTSADKPHAKQALTLGVEALAELQDMLYAQDRWAVLLIFQAMDAAGKDSAIKHVMSGINPQGCQVYAFKAPSDEDLDHDYLWRHIKKLPERGRIGIFNRSYYEETLVVRVHRPVLEREKIPSVLVDKGIWKNRCQDICAFERHLSRNGIAVCKFFLHVSKEEQKKRFLERLENPEKCWKFSPNDVTERRFWGDYMDAYEDTIRRTAAPSAPWYVVPADNKWFTRVIVAAAVIDTLAALDLAYPKVDKKQQQALDAAKRVLVKNR